MKVIGNKRVIYFGDPMVSGDYEDVYEEFKLGIEPRIIKNGLKFENVVCTEDQPFQERFDILFFDWGGMSMGNDLLGSYCRHITRQATDQPNTYYVMVSSFTSQAMKDALDSFREKPFNIFLNIDDFCDFYKIMEI